jgi:hypothetical protein
MASRAEILSSTKSRADKKSTLARNGRWNTSSSGAFLRAPQVTRGPGAAGSQEQAKANFFKSIIEDVIPAAKKFKDEKDKEQVNYGKASWTKASKEQRENWAFAIKNGYALEGESPYFRHGVMIAHTESLASKYSQEMFQRYEKWTEKNDPNSGSFDDWINQEDQTFQQDFENIDDEVLNEHFLPMQSQIRNNLRSRHTQRLNDNYRTQSYNTKQNAIFTKLRDFFGPIYEEGTQGRNFNDLIIRGREANQFSLETITQLQAIVQMENPTKADFMKVPNGQAMWERFSSLSSKKSDMLKQEEAVSVMDGERSMPSGPKKKEKKTEVATRSIKPVLKEEKKPAKAIAKIKDTEKPETPDDDMSNVNLSTQFKSLEHVAEVLNATPEEVTAATRAVSKDVDKGKFTSYKGKVFDDLNAIHPGNWNEIQTQKVIEAIRFAREEKGKAKSGS